MVGQRPGNGANGVAPSTPIVLFLSEPLNASTVAAAVEVTENGGLVTGTVQVTGSGQVVRFQPATPWAYNALVQVFLGSGAQDANGNLAGAALRSAFAAWENGAA